VIAIDVGALEQSLLRAGDGICVVSYGTITLWNRAAERILGYPARDVVGRKCCDVFAARDEHGNRLCYPGCRVTTLVRMQEPVQHFEMLTEARGGRTAWLDVSVIALPTARSTGNGTTGAAAGRSDGHDNATVLMYVFRDVTAEKELLDVVRQRFAAPDVSDSGVASAALTRREIEVLRLIAQGGKTKRVAEQLHVSPATVRNHVQNILGKLGAHSRLEAVAFAHRHRLL
jgi:PAS domain S-box-containing protein